MTNLAQKAQRLTKEIELALKDYFIAEIDSDGEEITMSFPAGETFIIVVSTQPSEN